MPETYPSNSSVWGPTVRSGNSRVIPLHVAELQVPTAEPIRRELVRMAETGQYGYTEPFEDFAQTVSEWCRRRHNWQADPAHIVMVPRVVHLLSLVAREYFGRPSAFVTLSPQYSPTAEVLVRNHAVLRASRLRDTGSGWQIDWEDLAQRLTGADALLLCSPHNPTGTVWSSDDVERLAQLADEANVLVVADEVHCDSVRAGRHTPFGKVARGGQRWISCLSPSKAFNLAGLETSAIVCSNSDLATWLQEALRGAGFHNANYFGLRALQVAWTECDDWLDAAQDQIQKNITRACEVIGTELPGLRPMPAAGTFLLWIDARAVGTETEISAWFQDADLIPALGSSFGQEFAGWLRLNLGLPSDHLEEVLHRLVITAPPTAR